MNLEATPGKTIADFCGSGFIDAGTNHCAHFVAHVLGLTQGMTCAALTGRGHPGASVRVHELFAACPEVGLLEAWPGGGPVLVFVTAKSNVDLASKVMRNVPKKHVGLYNGSHIFHYGNTSDQVAKQTVAAFKSTFRQSYGGDLGFYFGKIPGSVSDLVPAAGGAAPIVTWAIRDREVFARVEDGPEFYVARRTTYGSRVGLAQISRLTGPVYDPTAYTAEFGPWAHLVYAIGASESANRFNRINSYDRADFTFGFFQLAAHTPQDNLVLLLRRATALPAFQRHFPELQMKDERLHRITEGSATDLEAEVYNARQDERQLAHLMRYLNPVETQLDDAEIIHAARLVDLCEHSPEFCALQVRTAIQITARKFRERYQQWYDLNGLSDSICVAIADIHHQGRAKKAQVRAALASTRPLASLTKLGEDRYPERCRSLRQMIAEMEERGELGRHKYEPAHGLFVPV